MFPPLCPTLCDPVDCSPARQLCPRDFPGKNTGVGCHSLLQGIFPTQGLNLDFLHCRQILYCLRPRDFNRALMGFHDCLAVETERRKARNNSKVFRLVCAIGTILLLLETHLDPFGIHLFTLKLPSGIPAALYSFV